jgi:tetratricopeptide (TPR) repeat protein
MNTERIGQLLQYLQEEPGEPFNVYALAMEYLSHDRGQAQHYFEKLLTEHPQYLPTYYHVAQLYADLGDRVKAAMYYDFGLQLARQQNNQKTFDELQRAYRAFQDEEDE